MFANVVHAKDRRAALVGQDGCADTGRRRAGLCFRIAHDLAQRALTRDPDENRPAQRGQLVQAAQELEVVVDRLAEANSGVEALRCLLKEDFALSSESLVLNASSLVAPGGGAAPGSLPRLGFLPFRHRNNTIFWCRVEIAGDRVHCGAGVKLKTVAVEAKRRGLTSLEFLEGIPGSVGGALRMNAGAMGSWMFDVVETIRFMDYAGQAHERRAGEVNVEYRGCPLFKNHIALGAVLKADRTK